MEIWLAKMFQWIPYEICPNGFLRVCRESWVLIVECIIRCALALHHLSYPTGNATETDYIAEIIGNANTVHSLRANFDLVLHVFVWIGECVCVLFVNVWVFWQFSVIIAHSIFLHSIYEFNLSRLFTLADYSLVVGIYCCCCSSCNHLQYLRNGN